MMKQKFTQTCSEVKCGQNIYQLLSEASAFLHEQLSRFFDSASLIIEAGSNRFPTNCLMYYSMPCSIVPSKGLGVRPPATDPASRAPATYFRHLALAARPLYKLGNAFSMFLARLSKVC